MRRLFARFTLPLTAAAVVIAGGAAYALAASGGTITVCVKHNGGTLYKAKKCAKHDKKLSWNAKGPKGATGATGAPGSQGIQGPQGPGGSILTYNASASASPTMTTVGTLLADTWSAQCALTSGHAAATLFLKTSDGSWGVDIANNTSDTTSGGAPVFANHIVIPAGTITSPTVALAVPAGAAPDEGDSQIAITQFGPTPGSIVLHVTAADTTAPAQTCHVSIEAFPTTITAVSGSGVAHEATTSSLRGALAPAR